MWLYRLESSGSVQNPAAGRRVHGEKHVDISLYISSLFTIFYCLFFHAFRYDRTIINRAGHVYLLHCSCQLFYNTLIKIEVKITIRIKIKSVCQSAAI